MDVGRRRALGDAGRCSMRIIPRYNLRFERIVVGPRDRGSGDDGMTRAGVRA